MNTNSRIYKTNKGTELPLLNLRGKDYLEVKYRLVWFREDHPDWSIETKLIAVTDVSAYARATIRDDQGRIIATSHKFESIQGFPDFIEKAETGAIGRALALIGYGTQFCADELDEGSRIVDAPASPVRGLHSKFRQDRVLRTLPSSSALRQEENRENVATSAEGATAASETSSVTEGGGASPGEYTINFGRKYKGRKLMDIPKAEMESYLQWLETSGVRPGTALYQQVEFLKNAFTRYYQEPSSDDSAVH